MTKAHFINFLIFYSSYFARSLYNIKVLPKEWISKKVAIFSIWIIPFFP